MGPRVLPGVCVFGACSTCHLFALDTFTALRPRLACRRLVVDVREFMSGLPGVLHRQGFYITPVTLEV